MAKKIAKDEHYSVYGAFLIAHGVVDQVIFFSDFGNFFWHVKKLLSFVNITVTPAKLDHLGFY